MVPSNKLQTGIGVRPNAEPVSLGVIIDNRENYNVATLNRNNRPSVAMRLATIVTIRIYYDCEGANCSDHTRTRGRGWTECDSEHPSCSERHGSEGDYDQLASSQ